MQLVAAFFADFLAGARVWSRGRFWAGRLALWLWFAYLAVQLTRDPGYTGLIGGLNLGIHEFGHLICMPFGQFVTVLGGSLVQCLVPVISIGMFHRQEDYFAFSFSFVWLATNLCGVARYMADARALQLDLVTPFGGSDGEVIHDWNWIFQKLGWLAHDTQIAGVTRGLGLIVLWLGVGWGAWILWRMMTDRKPKEVGAEWPSA